MSQIDIIKEKIQYEQFLKEEKTSQLLKGEYLVKDSHPDAHRILCVDAKIIVNSTDILAEKIIVEGQIIYNVLYVSKDESDIERVYGINLSEKFIDNLDLRGEEHKVLCDVECVIEHIQANIMNERKISIDGLRSTKWNVCKIQNIEFVKDIEGDNSIQVKNESETVDKFKGDKDIELIGKSMIKVTQDKPEVEEILKCCMNLHKKEVKLGEDKIYFGCYCKIEVLYKGRGTDELVMLQDDVYLSKEEELVGITSDMMNSYFMNIVSGDHMVMTDDLGENRVVTVEFVAKGNVKVNSKENIELIEDAYSTNIDMNLIKEKFTLSAIQGMAKTDVVVKETFSESDEKIKNIVLSCGCLVVTDKYVEDDRVKVEGIVKVGALYELANDMNTVESINGEIPFIANLDIRGIKDNMEILDKVCLESLEASVEGDSVAFKAIIYVCAKAVYNKDEEWVTDVIVEEGEKKEKKSSVIIYFVNQGDTLWNLAKKYNTTVDELIRINELEMPEVLNIGQKLIMPGRAIF